MTRSFSLTWSSGHLVVGFGDIVSVDIEVRHGGQLLVLREADAPVPRDGSLDVRAHGLWLSLVDERDGRWTIGLEAFALAVDRPDDDRGELVALGLDVEVGDGRVLGELLVGDAVIALDEPAEWETSSPEAS